MPLIVDPSYFLPSPLHVDKVLKFLPSQSRYDRQMVLHVATQNFLFFPFFPTKKHFLVDYKLLMKLNINYPSKKINEIKGVAYFLVATPSEMTSRINLEGSVGVAEVDFGWNAPLVFWTSDLW